MRLLCSASVLPFPTETGHAWRCLGLLRALAAEHEVTLVTTTNAASTEADMQKARELVGGDHVMVFAPSSYLDRTLRGRARRSMRAARWRVPIQSISHYEPPLAAALARESRRHDAVVLLDNAVTIYWRKLTDARCVIVDIHNVAGWSLGTLDLTGATLTGKLRAAADLRLMRSYERRWLAATDAITVSSTDEAARLHALYGRDADEVIPSTVDPPARPQRAIGARTVGWLGDLTYPPNREGLLRFVHDAWPPLGEAGYELLVAGVGHTTVVDDLASYPGIRTLGFVQSLDGFLSRLGAAVVPLWQGAGVKLKTVSFLAGGVPVVSTTVGVEGLDTTHGRQVLVADQPEDLAAQLRSVLADTKAAKELGDAGRELILRDFSWDALGRRFSSVVERIAEKQTPNGLPAGFHDPGGR